MNEPTLPRRNRFFQSRFVRGILIIILLVTLIGLLSPLGIKWYAQRWLRENGADTATIDSLIINPFTGSVTLRGADVQRDGQVVFSDSGIHVNVKLWQLFSKNVHLEEIIINDVVIVIEQLKDKGFRIASYDLIASDGGTSQEIIEEDGEISKAIPWSVHAQRVDLSNVIVRFNRHDLDLNLTIDEGFVDRLGTGTEDRDGKIFFKGAVNGAPVTVNIVAHSITPGVALKGNIKWENFNLSALEQLLENIIHPLSGIVGIDGDVDVAMVDASNLTVSYAGEIDVSKAQAAGEGWSVDGATHFDGDVVYTMSSESDRSDSVQINGELKGNEISVQIPGSFQLEQENFAATTKTDISWQENIEVASEGKFIFSKGNYTVDGVVALDTGNISWEGTLGYQSTSNSQQVSVNGILISDGISALLPAQEMTVRGESLELRSDQSIRFGSELLLDGDSDTSLTGWSLSVKDEPLIALSDLDIAGFKQNESGGYDIKQVAVSGIALPISSTVPVAIQTSSLLIDSISSEGLDNGSIGKIQLKETSVTSTTKQQLASFDSIAMEKIQGDVSGNVAVSNLTGSGGKFLSDPESDNKPLVTLEKVNGKKITWKAKDGLDVQLINLESVMADYVREKTGPSSQGEKNTAEDKVKEKEKGGFPVKIDRIQLTGTSGLNFADETLNSRFSTSLFIEQGEITNIDFNKPEQPFNYLLKGNFDKYAPLHVEGKCAPFAELFYLEKKTTLRNYPLQNVSPYVVDAIGTYFESGQLDISSDLLIKGEDLNVESNYVFKGLEVKTVDGELAAKLNNSLPVPLEVALSMLRDSDGDIDLDVPISGKVSDLQIGITDILITAMSKAIAVGIAPYLAYTALGPTGALVYLGTQLGQKMFSTDFPGLDFEPGQNELSEEQEKILEKVGKSMEGKEQTYSICARVALSELGEDAAGMNNNTYAIQDEENRKQLFKRGEEISLLVQQFLLQKFDIDKERLLLCNPGFSLEQGAKTTIEFTE